MVKIQKIYWENHGTIPESLKSSLSPDEQNFVKAYQKINVDYQNSFPIGLDLTTDLEPPKTLYIEIRVLEDCGEFTNSEGNTLDLSRGSTLLVKKVDV